jgi:hypothetical protein
VLKESIVPPVSHAAISDQQQQGAVPDGTTP